MSIPPSGSPAGPSPKRRAEYGVTAAMTRNARYGLWLFAIYVLFYGGFVALSAFRPDLMGVNFAGVNLAIVYGLGLIVLAFLLALIYMGMARHRASDVTADGTSAEGRA
jgi:uncharacterized membrane protein (DUF485 family)